MKVLKIVDLPDDGALWKCENCYPEMRYPANKVKGIEMPNGKKIVLCLDCLKEALD